MNIEEGSEIYHIIEIINQLKEKYLALSETGIIPDNISFEIYISQIEPDSHYDEDDDIYDKREIAIKNLVDAGVIVKYEMVERYEGGHIPVYYAVCKINKNKLFIDEVIDNKENVLKGFNDIKISSLDLKEKIYLLKVLFSYFDACIIGYKGNGMFFVTSGIDDLNDYFKILRKKILELVKSDEYFNEFKSTHWYKEITGTITDLYLSSEYLDVIWDTLSQSLINIKTDIQDIDLENNMGKIYKWDIFGGNSLKIFLTKIENELEILEKIYNKKDTDLNEASNKERDKSSGKKEVIIDKRKGIYFKDELEKIYKTRFVQNGEKTKRFLILEKIKEKDYVSIKEIVSITEQGESLSRKEINNINKLFRKHTGGTDNLITNSTSGYIFNKDVYLINFKNF